MIQIYNLTEEQRKERIEALMDKLMNSGIDNVKRNTKWKNREFVFKTIQDYLHFLLVERNQKASEADERGMITEKEAFEHLERTYSYRNKPNIEKARKTMETLDTCFSAEDSNYILKRHGKICDDALENLADKLAVIQEYGYGQAIVESPQKLRGSAGWIRARLHYYTEMIAIGKEKRILTSIPASELLSDKDKFLEGNKKKISIKRKEEIKEQYGEGRE